MPRPKLYPQGRHIMKLEKSLASYLFRVSKVTGIPASQFLDEAVMDWKERKGREYLRNQKETNQ